MIEAIKARLGVLARYKRRAVLFGAPAIFMVLAFSSFMDASHSDHVNHGEADKYASQYADDAREQTQRDCSVVVPMSQRLDCQKRIEYTSREQQRREYEVEAQRDAAVWNRALGEGGYIGGLAGILTILLLYATYTAQVDTIRATRRIGEAQTRAYLTITSCKLMFQGGVPHIRPNIRNSGQSPALAVRWRAVGYLAHPPEGKARKGETNPEYRKQAFDIPSQGDREALYHNIEDLTLTPEDAALFADSKKLTLLVDVFTEGKDVFGRRITGADEFMKVFSVVPSDLDEMTMDLVTQLKPEEGEVK